MVSQSGIDEVVKFFMRGADSVAFSRVLQEGLADVLKNSDNADTLADDIVKWRDKALKQGDISSQTKEFLESPTTLLRMKSISKIQEVSLDFTKAVESNADNIDVDLYVSKLADSTPLSKGDLDSVRSTFDELIKVREESIKKVMDGNPNATRQDVLGKWAKQFDGDDAKSGASAQASTSQSEESAEILKRIDELEKNPSFSGTDQLYVKTGKMVGVTTLGLYGLAIADDKMGGPISGALGEFVFGDDVPPIISAMSDAAAVVIDGVSYALSTPAKAMGNVAIAGLEDNGKIEEGPDGDKQRALVMLISHVANGNALPALEVASGSGITAQEINDAVGNALSKDMTTTEAVQSVYLQFKDRAKDNQYGLAGGAFDSARKGVEKKKDELTQTANRLINNNVSGGGLVAMSTGLSDLFSKNTSSVFSTAADNLDKLGISGSSKMAFQFISAVANVAGMFNEDLKKSIQDFALSAFGIDKKISALKDATSNSRVVSQFGDKFGIGNHKPSAPELAAEL